MRIDHPVASFCKREASGTIDIINPFFGAQLTSTRSPRVTHRTANISRSSLACSFTIVRKNSRSLVPRPLNWINLKCGTIFSPPVTNRSTLQRLGGIQLGHFTTLGDDLTLNHKKTIIFRSKFPGPCPSVPNRTHRDG